MGVYMVYEDNYVGEVWAEEDDNPFINYGEGYEDDLEKTFLNNEDQFDHDAIQAESGDYL